MKSPLHPEVEMKKITKFGIEIEYCPVSGGVWLDKGELEKLLAAVKQNDSYGDENAPRIGGDDDDDYRGGSDRNRPRKRESFLSEIFDIF
ncbi:MAG: hypothetical protein TR69_WS6001000060 [candidate division WS6 bacterium OLB20]|uniref:Transcription factor zinc-finger domain-containing protein n=1 Tax=candidate division WS6 bacterium OLB20 TaxID=1617426 RepID=A0A136M161_9BACT|nr:MAG: hypothetical protein TR69_WS6001000060 [candidate division WS6 bacterium OLB20]